MTIADCMKQRPLLSAFCIFCTAFLLSSFIIMKNSTILFDQRAGERIKRTHYINEVKLTQVVRNAPLGPTPGHPDASDKKLKSVFIDDFFIPRNVTSGGITRIIHQSWKSKEIPSERMKRWSNTWKKCYPDWTYKFWTDEDNLNFIKKYYPWFLTRYNSLPSNIMRVDSVRYFYMLHYGGLYTDLDTECIRPFEHLLNASIVLGAMNGHWIDNSDIGHIQNSFMYSSPGQSYWLETIMDIYNRKQNGGTEDMTGPLLMMRILSKYKKRGIKNVMVYPGKYFNPFSWLRNPNPKYCKIQGVMSDEDEERCKETFKEAYVVQYHTKTWGGGRP